MVHCGVMALNQRAAGMGDLSYGETSVMSGNSINAGLVD
jgi:hypothetical protein